MKIDKERGVVEEKRFDYKGFPCVILFMDIGHRCGYVGIPEASGIDVEEIDCHGGITYGPSSHLHLQEDNNIEWIGFDTCHYCDGRDIEKIKEYFPDRVSLLTIMSSIHGGYKPKTLEFCEEQCKQIVDQVIDILGVEKMNKPLNIKIKYFRKNIEPIEKIAIGDWIDLRAAEDVDMNKGQLCPIRLGIGMILPEGYEAHIVPRSSTAKNFGILCANSMGVVDNSYSGDEDEWMFLAYAIRGTVIKKGSRICQFRIMPKMPEIDFEVVEHLNDISRGGFGSTGVK